MGAPANPANPTAPAPGDKAAASGDSNQAVATTSANADQPAKGANSFTKNQARHRIQKKGYSHVTGLAKDQDGVWRGTAQKGGQPINVWLDYKGNVGESSS
jgi:predicted transcriptional regulator